MGDGRELLSLARDKGNEEVCVGCGGWIGRGDRAEEWRLREIEEKLEAWLSRSGKRKLVGWGWILRGGLVESGGGQEDGWDILPSF